MDDRRVMYTDKLTISLIQKMVSLNNAINEVLTHYPDAPAAIQDDVVISYKTLMQSASRIASQIHRAEIHPGHRLALDLPRSLELYQAILGCLFAGVSFMSLPRNTDASIGIELAREAECVAILSNRELPATRSAQSPDIGILWTLHNFKTPGGSPSQSATEIYCVRTSGTTGQSKVVPIRDKQLNAFLKSSQEVIELPGQASWLWLHDLSFDLSIWEIFGCLLNRGCLMIINEHDKRDGQFVSDFLAKYKVNILTLTPSEYRFVFSQFGEDVFDTFQLTHIIFCGEKLIGNTLANSFTRFAQNNVRLLNTYGPSEATVFCSYYYISEADIHLDSVPIGKPLPGMKFELNLEEDSNNGELILHGLQVFDGYLGQKPLTDGYFTKDICRLNSDGQYVFVGRSGGYQKINGFRVELYEVEDYLQAISGVEEAVTWVENDERGDVLVAAIRVKRDTDLTSRDLRISCSKLPPYLRPCRYKFIDSDCWPINSRGKTDRLSLREY